MLGAPDIFIQQAVPASVARMHAQSAPSAYQTLSAAFGHYSEALELCSTDAEGARRRLQPLEEQWHASGLTGQHIPSMLRSFRAQIAWERMVPDMFNKFYRFVFHLCKLSHRKHISVEVALDVWQLLLTGRFRLLDKWCDFIMHHKPALKVVNEDQWRQVLDFSRSVHEDLSNYDPNGAWACFLDEFVEHMRLSRPGSRSQLLMEEDLGFAGPSLMASEELGDVVGAGQPMSPRCGSKRRSPDVDVVVERLSAIPLPSSQSDSLQGCCMVEAAHMGSPMMTWSGGQSGAVAAPTDSTNSGPQPSNSGGTGAVISSGGGRAPGSAAKRHCGEAARQALSTGGAAVSAMAGMVVSGSVSAVSAQHPVAPVMLAPLQGPASCATSVSMGLPPEPLPLQSFTFELPMVQVSGRRHIRSRRSNVSELVHNTVSEALFQ